MSPKKEKLYEDRAQSLEEATKIGDAQVRHYFLNHRYALSLKKYVFAFPQGQEEAWHGNSAAARL